MKNIKDIFVFCIYARPNFAKTKRGANGKFLPKPLLFHLRHPNSKKKISRSFAESFPQKIVSAKLRPHCFRFPRLDFLRKKFEFCPEHTARKRNRVRKQKYGRHEVPSVLNSPQKILNPKGFATQSVAPR
ncbi:MAG: hypothetical protein V9G19_26725 [Tetrasphaera sp.]